MQRSTEIGPIATTPPAVERVVSNVNEEVRPLDADTITSPLITRAVPG